MRRVYHPTLDAFQNVPEGDVEKWVEAGWLKSRRRTSTPTTPRPPRGRATRRASGDNK